MPASLEVILYAQQQDSAKLNRTTVVVEYFCLYTQGTLQARPRAATSIVWLMHNVTVHGLGLQILMTCLCIYTLPLTSHLTVVRLQHPELELCIYTAVAVIA